MVNKLKLTQCAERAAATVGHETYVNLVFYKTSVAILQVNRPTGLIRVGEVGCTHKFASDQLNKKENLSVWKKYTASDFVQQLENITKIRDSKECRT
ncbi:hypothetical protein PUN28_015015 [Cardiocondyla obscurior]|uniref:Uncharacterized protein n=1 Tax=Cardiocondyla obscurior TaxID=286306 RepID=A0AAW2EWF7_9HYME